MLGPGLQRVFVLVVAAAVVGLLFVTAGVGIGLVLAGPGDDWSDHMARMMSGDHMRQMMGGDRGSSGD